MQTQSNPSSNGSSWSTAPDQIHPRRGSNALDAQFLSFSFPPKTVKDAQAIPNAHPSKPDHDSLIGQQLEPTESESMPPNYKAYRSMSAPGVFPLKRRQSNSPLRLISYTEETSGEPCAVPEYYSDKVVSSSIGSPLWSPPISRSSVDYSDHNNTFQHLRRTSSPGTFTLKHMRQPSPLGLGSLVRPPPSPTTSSFEGSVYFSDAATDQHSHDGSESSNAAHSKPASHGHRATSLDGAHFENLLETQRVIYNQYRPRTCRSSGSFSLKHQNKPSPLGTQLPLSSEPESEPLAAHQEYFPLHTIVDESSSVQK